jgi:hypothetical protein
VSVWCRMYLIFNKVDSGTGFLQKPGSFHFRSTFLPPPEEIDAFIESITGFHEGFMKKFK